MINRLMKITAIKCSKINPLDTWAPQPWQGGNM